MQGSAVKDLLHIIPLLLLLSLCACAGLQPRSPQAGGDETVFAAEPGDTLLHRHAPMFLVDAAGQDYNRIGSPVVTRDSRGRQQVRVDPDRPALFAEVRPFRTDRGSYTNLVYRVHFERVPSGHLGAGLNVGLILVVTLDPAGRPLLYTSVHTCGCYLAFVATSLLPPQALPEGFARQPHQRVFGEYLPTVLSVDPAATQPARPVLRLRSGNHRVSALGLQNPDQLAADRVQRMPIRPLADLESLPVPAGGTTSFFETAGPRTGFVRDSHKPWERLLMSWWTLAWRIGEDKKYGADRNDGAPFFTSLKPWARHDSDMRDFADFLHYWGWRL